ncbi:MAG TPA: hypothetical protein VHF87_09000 [Methylomirabilota bacterium]|jgi:hypothetical protein|nr:hypothetical protein [Methylomirabilota bacterium]
MGLEVVVPRAGSVGLGALLDGLAAAGLPTALAMVDNVLQGPGATPPAVWRDARLRTPAGVVTLRRVPNGVAVVVFGNADEPLRTAQRTVAETLLGLH